MQSLRIAPVLLAVLLGAGLASAQQSLLVAHGQTIAFSGLDATPAGDVAPSLSMGERFGGNSGPNPAVIDDSGRVLFRAQLVDSAGMAYASNQQYLSRAYFMGDSRGNLVKVLRGGEPEPSGTLGGATLQALASGGVALGSSPRISSNGIIMFGANIWDGGATITNLTDTVLYVGTPGSWQMLAREGSAAPGCGGATYSSDFASMAYGTTGLNAQGLTLFQSALLGTTVVGTTNNIAWFTGLAGNVQLMHRKGDVTLNGEVLSSIGTAAQLNAAGQVLSEVTFQAGTGTPAVTTANDKALWLYTPGPGNAELLREGNASPIPNVLYGSPTLAGPAVLNSAGQALVLVPLTGAVTVGTDDVALFLVSQSNSSVVLRKGSPAPGVGGANFNGVANFNMCLNDSGTVAFTSTLIGGGVTGANDSGLWTGTAGNLTLIAREGDVAPASGGQTFGAFSSSVHLNAAGQILFANALSGGSFAQSLYSWDPVLGLQPVFFPGDSIEVQPGVFRILGSVSAVTNANGAGRTLGFTNDGTVTLKLSFGDGSSSVASVRIGSLTARPRKISAATGGTQTLYLSAGLAHAGQVYAVGGSVSGTNPGTPVGAFTVPLNWDWYTDFSLANFNAGPYVNTLGLLNVDGRAQAQIVVPPVPGFAGLIAHHAFGVLDSFGNLVFVSEAAPLEIIP